MASPQTRRRILVFSLSAAAGLVGIWSLGRTDDLKSPLRAGMGGTMLGGLDVPFSTVEHGEVGAWRCPCEVLIRSAAEWEATMAGMGSRCLMTNAPVPEVNWERSMVLLVALGEKSASGYAVEIQGVHDEGPELVVDAALTTPGGKLTHQTVTAPFHLIQIERREATSVNVRYTGTGESTSTERSTWGGIKKRFAAR